MIHDPSAEQAESSPNVLPQGRSSTIWAQLAAAIAFYTAIPMPRRWVLDFQGVARLAPFVGIAIGCLLGLVNMLLQGLLGMPDWTRSTLVVVSWIALTGGLHLDGAMDTADGLAVQDPQRRLEVMTDSHTGAFGVMTAIALILLKIVALVELTTTRWIALVLAAGWGRWGQLVAIARYPYLKPVGKGAFHKQAIRSTTDLLPGMILLAAVSGLEVILDGSRWPFALSMTLGGFAIAVLSGAWFNRQLGGHTGDTYGAVVEWTEALFLCILTIL